MTKWKKISLSFLLVTGALAAGYLLRTQLDQLYERSQTGSVQEFNDGTRVGRELVYAENVSGDNPILQDFLLAEPETKVLLACEEDLTNDGLKDLVVLYSKNEDIEKGFRYTPVWLTVATDSSSLK